MNEKEERTNETKGATRGNQEISSFTGKPAVMFGVDIVMCRASRVLRLYCVALSMMLNESDFGQCQKDVV